MARDLAAAGSPVALDDFRRHRARLVTPLALEHSAGTVYNIPPPTQGVVSLVILGVLDRLAIGGLDHLGADYVHLAVEATKQAFSHPRPLRHRSGVHGSERTGAAGAPAHR